ncbi:MAG TPA: hypothetical protein VKB51_04725 [bacterium]|nr:hypothetical protein [bacterium]
MRNRTPISIFPFLSVLLSTLGVLSFLAVTFVMFTRTSAKAPRPEQPVEVQWVGAPPHVRPILVECRQDAVVVHSGPGGKTRRFDLASLQREQDLVRGMVQEAYGELGPVPSRTQLWFYMKSAIQNERRLVGSFTRAMHDVEIDDLSGQSKREQVERYPILLVYPDGITTYDVASYLVETTTRLSVGLEPMLKGWKLPYQKEAS